VRPANPVLALLVFLIGGQAMAEAPASASDAIATVTLDVYSGRPNPSWPLTPAQIGDLQARIKALSTPLAGEPDVPDLGYRGVSVSIRGKAAADVSAARGAITVTQGGSVAKFQDTNRQLERWLVHTGDAQLSPDLLRMADSDLSR
jgi:hypothetical protein